MIFDNTGVINFSFAVTGVILSVLGLIFVFKISYIEKITRRFLFSIFLLTLLYVISDLISQISLTLVGQGSPVVSQIAVFFESFWGAAHIPLLAFYLITCTKEKHRSHPIYIMILVINFLYDILLIYTQYSKTIYYIDDSNIYHRGPYYPLLLLPLVLNMGLILFELIRKRKTISRTQFYAFFMFIIIPMIAMLIQMFTYGLLLSVIGTVIATTVFFQYILSQQVTEFIAQRNLNEIYETDILLLQMRPHFIYNTMSSIYYLCELDPKRAQNLVGDFSTYLKKNFSALSKQEMITFKDELVHTQAYLAVEKSRYEKLLFVDYDTPHTEFRMPPLILQPIVENAVKHGLDPDLPPLHIYVKTEKSDGINVITVEDSGPGYEPVSKGNKDVHIGLNNVKERLKLMCKGTLTISPRQEGGTIVTIRIPEKYYCAEAITAP